MEPKSISSVRKTIGIVGDAGLSIDNVGLINDRERL